LEAINQKALSANEIVLMADDWRRLFKKGAMGNKEAYNKARDTRAEIEEPRWIHVSVLEAWQKQLEDFFENRPEITVSIEPFDAKWMNHKEKLRMVLESNKAFCEWFRQKAEELLKH